MGKKTTKIMTWIMLIAMIAMIISGIIFGMN